MTLGVLWDSRIIELNGQKPPLTYKRFQALISRMELPKKPVGSVTSQQMESCRAEIQENHDETYGVPSLEELGAYFLPRATHAGTFFFVKELTGFFFFVKVTHVNYRRFRKFREMRMEKTLTLTHHPEKTTINFAVCPSRLFLFISVYVIFCF